MPMVLLLTDMPEDAADSGNDDDYGLKAVIPLSIERFRLLRADWKQ